MDDSEATIEKILQQKSYTTTTATTTTPELVRYFVVGQSCELSRARSSAAHDAGFALISFEHSP